MIRSGCCRASTSAVRRKPPGSALRKQWPSRRQQCPTHGGGSAQKRLALAVPPNSPGDAIALARAWNKPVMRYNIYKAARCALFLRLRLRGNRPYSAATLARQLALRDRRLRHPAQMLPDLVVPLVEIRAKLERAVLVDERGVVDEEDRHRFRQWQAVGVAERDPLIDRLDRPLQQQCAQFARVLHPYAAMAAPPAVGAEQVLQRRVVQIDVEAVRHLELDLAERALLPGAL